MVPIKTRILFVHEFPLLFILLVERGYGDGSPSTKCLPKTGEGLLGSDCILGLKCKLKPGKTERREESAPGTSMSGTSIMSCRAILLATHSPLARFLRCTY